MKNGWEKRLIAIVLCMSMVISAHGIVIAAEPVNQITDENEAVQDAGTTADAVVSDGTELSPEIQTELITENQSDIQNQSETEIEAENTEELTTESITESITEYESETEMSTESDSRNQTETEGRREFVYRDGTVEVKAVLSEAGILPEGVELKVDRVTDKNELKEVGEQLTDFNDSEEDNFLAYDIRFEKENQEVEPEGEVFVTMNFTEAVKPKKTKSPDSSQNGEVSVLHLKETQDDRKVVELSDAQINTTEEAQVNRVEFAVDSFSKFVILWAYSSFSAGRVSVEYVDMEGADLTGPIDANKSIRFENNQEINIADTLAGTIKNYHYKKAVLKSDNSIELKRLKASKVSTFEGVLFYSPTYKGDDWIEVTTLESGVDNLEAAIQLVYESDPVDLTTVETVSTPNIKINLYDYLAPLLPDGVNWVESKIGSPYNTKWKGAVTQGLVQDELAPNGYPVAVLTNTNLISLYGPDAIGADKSAAIPADNLFQVDEEGYYYFDSAKNYAYLDQTQMVDGKYKFKLYNSVGAPKYDPTLPSYSKGNFVPFNDLSADMTVFPDTNGMLKIDNANMEFGMTVEFDFIQPENGKINGKDMTLDFCGDDDIFVFIDNKLVLDIGGCHEASAGSINFATGEVINENVAGSGYTGVGQTVISSMWDKMGNVFQDGSRHTLKLFYTDRGGAANCKMRFNIPQAPKKSLTVIKELSNTDKQDYANTEFGFKLYVCKEGEQNYTLIGDDENAVIGAVNSESEEKLVMKDGVFYLKPGQQAVFPKLDENIRYYVEEVGIVSSQFDKVLINNEEAVAESEANGVYTVRSPRYKLSEQMQVTFTNHCSDANSRTLDILKVMKSSDMADKNTSFHFQVRLESTAGEMVLYEGLYDIYEGTKAVEENKISADGVIILKAGQTARIYHLLSGTSFQVAETGLDTTVYQSPIYNMEGADVKTGIAGITGEMKWNQDAAVTVTNSKRELSAVSLTINKTVDKYNSVHGDAIFTFKITNTDTKEVLYRTIRFTGNGKQTTQSVTIQNLPQGSYRVEELETLRYQCADNVVQSIVLDEKGGSVSFKNIKKNVEHYSDSDVVINHFTMDEDGNIVITPDSAEQN